MTAIVILGTVLCSVGAFIRWYAGDKNWKNWLIVWVLFLLLHSLYSLSVY